MTPKTPGAKKNRPLLQNFQMTTPAKTLSPAELAKLEHAFAADPSSEAYRPLAEAYLAAGRFMEAMVVCMVLLPSDLEPTGMGPPP